MSVDDATWSEIRRCYCDGRESVVQIAARFDVSVGAIRYRVRRYGWSRKETRQGLKGRTGAGVRRHRSKKGRGHQKPDERLGEGKSKEPGTTCSRSRGKRIKEFSGDQLATREEVFGRLYRAILTKLSRLEERMKAGPALSAAESERETRELSTMVRSFEKVTGVAAELAKERKPKTIDRAGDTADAERMRREIAERLERLHAQWDVEGRPGESG